MIRTTVLAALLLVPAASAHAYDFTCDQVRQAVRTLPKSVLRTYAAFASADDVRRARKCLHPLGRRRSGATS
jgi:hypothetical protein